MSAGPATDPLEWALFDLDGCLVDSSRAIPACINEGLAAVGLPPRDPASLSWCIGPPLAASFTQLLAEDGHPDPDRAVADALDGYRTAFPELAVELTTVVDGIELMLDAVPQRRAVVTSKPAAVARPLVAAIGLADAFEVVHGPGLDVEDEPKEVTLARALDDLGITAPPTAAMIGDRHHDVTAGRANGTATIAVTWGAGDRTELADAEADHVVDTVDELQALLVERPPGRWSQDVQGEVGVDAGQVTGVGVTGRSARRRLRRHG